MEEKIEQTKRKSIQELRAILKAINKENIGIITNEGSKLDIKNLEILHQIQTMLKQMIEIKNFENTDLNLEKHINSIITKFEQIEVNDNLKKSLIQSETNAIIAHSIIKLLKNAEFVLDNPSYEERVKKSGLWKKGSSLWINDTEAYKHIAKIFMAYFPRFFGYLIKSKVSGIALGLNFRIWLVDNPSSEYGMDKKSAADVLIPIMRKFLWWESKKIGSDVYLRIQSLYNGKNMLIQISNDNRSDYERWADTF